MLTYSVSASANKCVISISLNGTNRVLAKQEEIKKGLQAFVQQATTLIGESERCGSSGELAQAITTVGINSLSSLGAIAPMAGLGGTVLAMGGQLLNSLVAKIFSSSSPKEGVRALYNEMEAENLACLWFALQNRALNCVQRAAALAKPRLPGSCQPSATPVLGKQSVGLLSDLDSLVRQAAKADDLEWTQKLLEHLDSPMEDPEGAPGRTIPLYAYLGQMRDGLARSKKIQDQQYAAQLQTFLSAFEKLRTAVENGQTTPLEQRMEVFKGIAGAAKQSVVVADRKALRISFMFPKIVAAYWRNKGKGDELSQVRALSDRIGFACRREPVICPSRPLISCHSITRALRWLACITPNR